MYGMDYGMPLQREKHSGVCRTAHFNSPPAKFDMMTIASLILARFYSSSK